MRSKDYLNDLHQELQDLDFAAEYLRACLQEGESTFLVGLKDVVEANGGIGSLAQKTNLNREGLYRMLSEQGNPTFYSLTTILDSLGLQVQFSPKIEGTEAA